MTIRSWELVKVSGERITVDLLIWRRYRRPAPGMLEAMLDGNPQIAAAHRSGPFLPVGMEVRIPVDPDILSGRPNVDSTVTLYGGVDA